MQVFENGHKQQQDNSYSISKNNANINKTNNYNNANNTYNSNNDNNMIPKAREPNRRIIGCAKDGNQKRKYVNDWNIFLYSLCLYYNVLYVMMGVKINLDTNQVDSINAVHGKD